MKNKIIKVNNDKELISFFRKLWLYKLQKNTLFILEEDIFGLNKIITALNIKNRKKRIEFVYDEACFEVDNYFKNKNICGFINNQCYTQRGTNKYNVCCRICRYQSSKGCTTSNLCCKLFFCSEVRKRCMVIEYKDLNILRVLTWKERLLIKSNYFSSREDILNDLYTGSLVVGSIRKCYRIIKTFMGRKGTN